MLNDLDSTIDVAWIKGSVQLRIISKGLELYWVLGIQIREGFSVHDNKTGPRTDPWGTPNDSGAGPESCPNTETNSILPVIYDLNHASAVLSTPRCDCSHAKRISWSMVSKAADRSSNTTMEILPPSILASRSLMTRGRAVSELCPVRYADWKGLLSFDFRWSWSWQRTVFSNSLDKHGRLDIGL